jgi:hypothetical protein
MKISALLTKTLAFLVYRVKSSWLDDGEGEASGNDDKTTMATEGRIKKKF